MKASDVIAIVSIVSTAATAIVVSVLTFRNSRQLQESRLQDERTQQQQETTRAMHREFNAPDMTLSRTLAWATVHAHHTENFDWMRRKLHPQEIQNVWNVMYFYQRLSLALRFGNIYEDYVPKMFGENFLWWYEKSYKDQLVGLNWQAGLDIAELMNWMKETNSKDIERWQHRVDAWLDAEILPSGDMKEWRDRRHKCYADTLRLRDFPRRHWHLRSAHGEERSLRGKEQR